AASFRPCGPRGSPWRRLCARLECADPGTMPAMNYEHIYHAGNFADVAKHVALVYCIRALQRKDAAIFVLDSHAGRGYYDLQAPQAHKSGEAERGIQRLIDTSIGEQALADFFAPLRA